MLSAKSTVAEFFSKGATDPVFSVVTPVFNSQKWIVGNIESVNSQKLGEIEHLIQDAGSSDDTFCLAQAHIRGRDRIAYQQDSGIYDGMNKGIARASGRYIAILNADDRFYSQEVLSRVARCFEQTGADCVFGNIQIIDRGSSQKPLRLSVPPESIQKMISSARLPGHPAFFVRKTVYESIGAYNWKDYPNAADIDFIARAIKNHSFAYLPETLTVVSWGGFSNRTIGNVLRGHLEFFKAWMKNELPVGPKFTLKRALHLAGALLSQVTPLQSIIHRLWERGVKKLDL